MLCGFFFVQAQAAFIAHAYNDYAFNGEGAAFQHYQSDNFLGKGKAGITQTQAKFKLNKRFQPANSPALLPNSFELPPFFAVVSKTETAISSYIFPIFLYSKPLRGPPSFWVN